MRFFIADCHFFHGSLNVQMDNRGFSSTQEMNAHMLAKWNDRVRDKDDVVILGDLSIGNAKETNALLEKLHGHLYLIRGNHDRFGRDRHFNAARFEWIKDYAELKDNNRKLILSHYPIMFYNTQYHVRQPKTGGLPEEGPKPLRDELPPRTWMLYGHVHDTTDEHLMQRFIDETRRTSRFDARTGETYHIPCQMINCFCMFSDYVPMTLDEWIEIDAARREKLREKLREEFP